MTNQGRASRARLITLLALGLAGVAVVVWLFGTYFLVAQRLPISIGREADGQWVATVCADIEATDLYVAQRTGYEWVKVWTASGHASLLAESTLQFGIPPEGMTNEISRSPTAENGEITVQVVGTGKSFTAYFPSHDYSGMRPGTWYYTDGSIADTPCRARRST